MKCAHLTILAVILSIASLAVRETKGDLTLSGPQCMSKICRVHEYCSSYDNQCHPCSDICNQNTHNYDDKLCIKQCQDYLHDNIYVRKDGVSSGKEDLRVVVQKLQHMVTVTLTLTCFVLLALVLIIAIQVWKWTKNNDVTFATFCSKLRSKKSNANENKPGNGVTVGGTMVGKPDLRLDMTASGTQSEHSPATVTTNISRRPAEDSALDYAYDNHAMSNSPSPNSKPHESNF